MTKRVLLFVGTNLLILTAISLITWFFGLDQYITQAGLNYHALITSCLIWGFGGAFISLGLSRMIAKWAMRIHVINPTQAQGDAKWLVDTTHSLCHNAGLLKMPEVGIYESDEPNAFATGPTRNRSLIAVSTGLLGNMEQDEVKAVLAHEVAHIVNGDMVTMTLIQGVINAFVMFLARVIAYAAAAAAPRNLAGVVHLATVLILQIAFSLLGSIVVCYFSRQREFRADLKAARWAGKEKMQAALCKLEVLVAHRKSNWDEDSYATLKITSTGKAFLALFATHPPLEERIERLNHLTPTQS